MNQRKCRNCDRPVYLPDPRVGIIHTNERYVCDNNRTVAT